MRTAGIALVTILALGCESSGPVQRDAGHDALTDASFWYQDGSRPDTPRPRPDVAPVPGLTVTVDGKAWYVLGGSTSWNAGEAKSYITATLGCDECTDAVPPQFTIKATGISENTWPSDGCGPSANTIDFMRSSVTSHPWESGIDGNCGFQISEAGGQELGQPPSLRVVGSFHGKVINIDSQITTTYDLGIDFDLALGVHFP